MFINTPGILQSLHAKQHEDLILVHTLELCHLKVGNGEDVKGTTGKKRILQHS
jgi:hypothetical protein